jgi:uncharacterized protein (DUF849 family)
MSAPCIICVAITGSVAQKTDNPAVPITVAEQLESAQAAFEAGASIAHCHVREDDGTPSPDPERFARLKDGLERHCPGTRVYENPPDLVDWLAGAMRANGVVPEIEIFDLSHIFQAAAMYADGRLPATPYLQFVMGVKNAMPADRRVFEFYVETVERLFPGAPWCAAGIGRHQIELNDWAIRAGGHARTGLEDNVRMDRDTLAPSNAALVARAAELCARHGRPVASPEQAREILGLARG